MRLPRWIRKIGWSGLLVLCISHAEAQRSVPIYLEGEFGVDRFSDAPVRSVFPLGAAIRLGAAFATANEGRLRLRPQGGIRFFGNKINEEITEQLLIVKAGGQISYDAFFVGPVTFFPYVAFEYNWVSNFDMESYTDDDASYSEGYLRGHGSSQEVGLRIQVREWFVKVGYEWFNPRLRLGQSIVEEDLLAGYISPATRRFRFDALNISIGFSIWP